MNVGSMWYKNHIYTIFKKIHLKGTSIMPLLGLLKV